MEKWGALAKKKSCILFFNLLLDQQRKEASDSPADSSMLSLGLK